MASSKRSLILDDHPLMTKTIMPNATRGASRVVEDFTERVVEARRQNILIHHFHHHHRHRHHHIIVVVVILLFLILINFRQLAAYARERARKTKTR